jgi:hypothetical protein
MMAAVAVERSSPEEFKVYMGKYRDLECAAGRGTGMNCKGGPLVP